MSLMLFTIYNIYLYIYLYKHNYGQDTTRVKHR
jgi:hypothetical protein